MGAWTSLGDDSVFEELPPVQERIPLRSIFLSAVREAIEEPLPPPKPPVETDLPKRKGRMKKVVMTREHKKAVHALLDKKVPLDKIQKKYNVTKVALRLHRRKECTCQARGII
jgi:hypothetical protein